MANALLSGVGIHHFSVSVADLDAAIAWYGRVFGFEIERRMEIAAIPARGAFLKRGALRLELWQTIPGAAVPENRKIPDSDLHSGGTKHIAFAVPDLQERLVGLVAAGVDIASVQRQRGLPMRPDPEPLAPGKPPAYAAFIRDPFGTLIELIDPEAMARL